jgi:cytochrome oxidase Cu insertion factor (SCO1/SenC/PrrC family)
MMIRRSLILVCLLAGCDNASRPSTTVTTLHPDLNMPVGQFSLTERSGRTVGEKDLQGTVWVSSFIFTRCMGPCPAVTATVARLQKELKDEPRIKFVTFTVDPAHDDMKKLKEYANHFNADPERWLFLTGDETTIHKLMKEQFKQAVERKSGEDVKPGDKFGHSTRLVLVDRNGLIQGFYDGLPNEQFPEGKEEFERNLKRLEDKARELAK